MQSYLKQISRIIISSVLYFDCKKLLSNKSSDQKNKLIAIKNYRLKDFIKQKPELINEYVTALQYVRPKETKNKVYHLSLKDVEFIKKNIYTENDEALIEIISKVQDIKKKKVFKLRIVDFFKILTSIKKQITIISKAEESSLTSSEINLKWLAVNGDERMSKFGIYNTLELLSNGDALKYEDYMNKSYSEIFTILLMRKTASDLKLEMEEIKLKND